MGLAGKISNKIDIQFTDGTSLTLTGESADEVWYELFMSTNPDIYTMNATYKEGDFSIPLTYTKDAQGE